MSNATSSLAAPASPGAHRRRSAAVVILGLMLLGCYSYFFSLGDDWNSVTRLALVHAVVDDGTLSIDRYQERTGDKALYRGHYYCDKAVGASFLGAALYRVIRPLFSGRGFDSLWFKSNALLTVLVSGVPTVIAATLLFVLLGWYLPATAPRVWVVLAYGLGTLAFPYSIMFLGHQTAAAFGFIAFFILVRMRRHGWSAGWIAVAGCLAGYALVTDFLAGVVVAGLIAYLAAALLTRRDLPSRRRLLYPLLFAVGVAAPLPLQLWYNWQCFGSPLASAYQYEASRVFAEGMRQGVMGITYPKLEALYQLTFGPARGLFYGSPVLLFAIPGIWRMVRRQSAVSHDGGPTARLEGYTCAGIALATILVASSYYMWRGGNTYGPRFLIVAIPFLALAAAFALPAAPVAFKALAALSILFTSVVVITNVLVPEELGNPLFEGSFGLLVKHALDPRPPFTFTVVTYATGVSGLPALVPLALFIAGCLTALRRLRLP